MTTETDLILGLLVIPAGAGRGITQTLSPVDNGDLRRTVNGSLVDLTRNENRKFQSTVSVSDFISPTLAGIWKGSDFSVSCISVLRQRHFAGGLWLLESGDFSLLESGDFCILDFVNTVELIRYPVTGTVFGRDSDGDKVIPTSVVGKIATFAVDIEYVEFRPLLQMMVVDISLTDDEYAAKQDWAITLEEV